MHDDRRGASVSDIDTIRTDGASTGVNGRNRPTTSKVLAIHLNYRDRALQRGRIPGFPSYFVKPSTSVSGGGEIVQPQGTELACYEGEIAVIIGKTAHNVEREAAHDYIGWYAAANDFGVHDFRWADHGSNLLAKGQDGYTPIGNWIPADGIAPTSLRLRTTVNGEVRQDAESHELLFSFADLVADLSRFMTLEPGDVILAGTPAGTGPVGPGDTIEVTLEAPGGLKSTVTSTIVRAPEPMHAYGAIPKVTEEARAFVYGRSPTRPVTLSSDATAMLLQVSTATLTVHLERQGVDPTFLAGLRPSRPDLRMVGYAHTLRYVAFRADFRESQKNQEDAQKRAVESVMPDDVLIMEARGVESAGTIGDILAARVLARGGAGIVTDGGVRDATGVAELDIPTYYRSAAAPSLWTAHIPLDVGRPITCAGQLVLPGDIVVGDAEGVVILPSGLAERIAHDAFDQELRERWSLERVQAGESIRGVYPISSERIPEYEQWRAEQSDLTEPDIDPAGSVQ